MTGVQRITVGDDANGKRLDRWIRAKFPHLGQPKIEKYCRKGEIRINGKRAKASDRLIPGQSIRLPPLPDPEARLASSAGSHNRVSAADAEIMRAAVIYMDNDFLAINKPPGTPVQGGTGQHRHVDAFASALRFGKSESPRLVHRLDKDTSGVLVLARSEKAAREITKIFRNKEIRKQYLAVVVGVPRPFEGTIKLALAPSSAGGMDRMQCIEPSFAVQEPGAKSACTGYRVIERVGKRASLVELTPVTGR
ncbi:MAG: RluA family pseudouridine synthase, partial [Albidovulum sp.]|nr:RluA family pseudouridine synthase [Albidovulum sp.]